MAHNTEYTIPGMHTHQQQNAEHTRQTHTLDIRHCVRCITLITRLGTQNHTHTARQMELATQQPAHSAVNTKSDAQCPAPDARCIAGVWQVRHTESGHVMGAEQEHPGLRRRRHDGGHTKLALKAGCEE